MRWRLKYGMKKYNIKKHPTYWRMLFSFIRKKSGWGSSLSAPQLTYWRRFIFSACALGNYKLMANLLDFFGVDPFRLSIAIANPAILEQATRHWLYYHSTMQERVSISKEHFLFLQSCLSPAALRCIYLDDGILLWSQQYQDDTLSLKLNFDRFYRKEGLLAVTLNLGDKRIYQASFWVAQNRSGEMGLWIGALQGSSGELQTIRDLTKYFFGYRTKNLIIHVIRTITIQLQLKRIYAVSIYGFQASHNVHSKRRLKTSLDEFWKEEGGNTCKDLRFFELPLIELRKSQQEIASHKRNLYRKRFAAIDAVDMSVTQALEPYLIS